MIGCQFAASVAPFGTLAFCHGDNSIHGFEEQVAPCNCNADGTDRWLAQAPGITSLTSHQRMAPKKICKNRAPAANPLYAPIAKLTECFFIAVVDG
jgi:hypothetical protein